MNANPSNPAEISQKVKSWGLDLGFDEVAICKAEPLEEAQARLQTWLNRGFHGSMSWMLNRADARVNPAHFFPEAKSVVVVALNYFREDEDSGHLPSQANISLYARGRDYHKVLKKKLGRLLRRIEAEIPGASGRICVDSFPVMEKPLAVRAGMGWIGKHTNLIRKGGGSYFFLGELLLDLDLAADPPFPTDHCGTCNRCQIACPTNALEEAFVLDARRCISYLTIEHDDEIAPSLADKMGNWVFGCDICQAVCPWNRFSSHTGERDFDNRLPDNLFDLAALQRLTREQFESLFAGTPVRRAGYENFRRNVDIAIRNNVHGDAK